MKLRKTALVLGMALTLGFGSAVAPLSLNQAAFAASKPLTGTVNNPLWVDSSRLVVETLTDLGTEFYLLSLNGNYEKLLEASVNATELVVSPTGTQAAYVNDNGDLYLIDLSTKVKTKISTDNEAKMELQFNEAGTKIYFLYGEKIDKLGVINLADGKLTTLLSDGVAYKSDLKISKDEKKAVYAVTKAGKVDEANDAFTVDSKGTEPQLSTIALTETGAKPVQVTSKEDNKVFTNLLADNSVLYVSAYADKDGLPLRKISADGKTDQVLVGHLSVEGVLVLKSGDVLLVGQNKTYAKSIFTVDQNGMTKKLVTLPEGTTSVVAQDNGQICITVETEQGEKVSVLQNGKFIDLTK